MIISFETWMKIIYIIIVISLGILFAKDLID